jgi:hypothetical protein
MTDEIKQFWQDNPDLAWGLKGANAVYQAASARTDAIKKNNILGFEAQQYANQAAIAGYQAQLDQQAGALREQDAQLQTAGQFGASRARLAASGIDLGQGSATDVLASTEYMGERQAMMIRDDTNRQVWQDQVQQIQAQAQQQYKLAQANAINPDTADFGSFLGSASSFAMDQWGGGTASAKGKSRRGTANS